MMIIIELIVKKMVVVETRVIIVFAVKEESLTVILFY